MRTYVCNYGLRKIKDCRFIEDGMCLCKKGDYNCDATRYVRADVAMRYARMRGSRERRDMELARIRDVISVKCSKCLWIIDTHYLDAPCIVCKNYSEYKPMPRKKRTKGARK